MVNLTIDNKKIETEEGRSILEAARDNGIVIPTLCHNESLGPLGTCRLCVVEVKQGNKTKIAASCMQPAAEGMTVDTKSERVMNVRRTVLQLLMARCPGSAELKALAAGMGIAPEPSFSQDKDRSKCILCRMCVETCAKVVGVCAIDIACKGSRKASARPFIKEPSTCIGCGACAYVCPTGHIEMQTTGDTRTIWGRTFKMKSCKVCGRFFAPEDQLAFIMSKTGVSEEDLATCVNCR
jgi:bidirectional [NiFe] hydrogenase diaphorase subunit